MFIAPGQQTTSKLRRSAMLYGWKYGEAAPPSHAAPAGAWGGPGDGAVAINMPLLRSLGPFAYVAVALTEPRLGAPAGCFGFLRRWVRIGPRGVVVRFKLHPFRLTAR